MKLIANFFPRWHSSPRTSGESSVSSMPHIQSSDTPIALVKAATDSGKDKHEVLQSLKRLNAILKKDPPGHRANEEYHRNVETALGELMQGLGSLPPGKAQRKAMDIIEKHFSHLDSDARENLVQSARSIMERQNISGELKNRLQKMNNHGGQDRKLGKLVGMDREIQSESARWRLFPQKKNRKKDDKPGVTSNDFQRKLKTLQSQYISAPISINQKENDDEDFVSATSSMPEDEFSPESSPAHPVIHDSSEQRPAEQVVSAITSETHEIHQENSENPDAGAHPENDSGVTPTHRTPEINHSADDPAGVQTQAKSEEKSGDWIAQKSDKYDEVGVTSLGYQEQIKKLKDLHAGDEDIQNADDAETVKQPIIDLHKKMIIHPQKHEINQENLRKLAIGLMSYFKHKGMSDALGASLVNKLRTEQRNLLILANKENADQADLGIAVRDCYKRMVKHCKRQLYLTMDKQKKEMLSTLIAFFDELKRHHLSHAATPIFKKYGAKTAERIKKTAEGFGPGYAGSTLLSTNKGEISVSIKGTTTAIEVKKDDTLIMDDDNEFMYTELGSGQVKFGFGIVDKLKGAISGKLYKGGQYRKTNDLPGMIKVLAKDKANNPCYVQSLLLRNSAGPGARNLVRKYEKGLNAVLARNLDKGTAAPLYLPEKKIAKGAYNMSSINSHARRLDELLKMNADGNLNLSGLIKTAYPEHADVVQSLRHAGQEPLCAMCYVPLPVLVSGTAQRGREKKTTITGIEGGLEFALRLSDGKIVGNDFGYLFDAKANLMGRRRETALERLKPMHAITSVAYTKDIRVSMNLWNKFERAHKNGDKESSKLNLYRKSNNALSKTLSAADSVPLSAQDINCFGTEIDIPEIFLRTVRAPKEKWGDLLVAVAENLDDLCKIYDNFESEAAKLLLENRPTDTRDMKEEYATTRKESVLKIEAGVWGRQGEYQNSTGVKEADLANPGSKTQLEFIADSHDAISAALGSLGTHLEILKAKLRDNQDPKLEDGEKSERDKDIINKIKKAEANYKILSKAIDANNVPVPRDPLYRFSTISWGTVSTKNELESQLRVVMGGNLDLLPAILKKTTDLQISVDLQNDATAADFSVGCKYTQQDHPNYSRKGDFIEVVVSIGGANPLIGAVMEKSLKKVSKTIGVDLPTTKETGLNQIKDLVGGVALDAHKRYQFVCRWHKYAELPDNKYEFQYLKILEQRDEGIAPIVKGIPLKIKEKLVGGGSLAKNALSTIAALSISGRSGQEVRNPIFEFMGNDLGHHIINFNHLDRLYKAAEADAKKKKAEEDKVDVKNVKVDPDAVYSSLRDQLEKKEHLYKKLQFFSSNSIFHVVKDYQKFIDWKENGKGAQPQNGFMFYNTDKIQESARVFRKMEAIAVGKEWPPVEKPSLAEPIAVPDIQTLERAEETLDALDIAKANDTDKKQSMANKRIDYFLKNKDGQAIFKAYFNIISVYKELNAACNTLHTYSSYVREKEPNMQALRRIGKTAKNTGIVLVDVIRRARAIRDAASKAEAFLREKNLFAGEKKSHNKIVDTRHSGAAKQTESWLRTQKISVARNGFEGAHGFIVAYLQQVTGRYDKLHLEEARKYLQRITNSSRPSKSEMKAIVEEINRDYGMPSMYVRLVTPGDEGHPVWTGDIKPLKAEQKQASPVLKQEQASPVVILRDRNAKGEETFAALARKNKSEQKFDDAWPRENLEVQLRRLEKKREARDQATVTQLKRNGIKIRETMKSVGELQNGVVKNVVAKAADIRRPMREAVRGLTDGELTRWVNDAYEKGNKSLWMEGMKEKKKREEMMALLENGGVLSIRNEKVDRTGKELRQIKDAADLRERDYSSIARFKKKVSSIMSAGGNKLNKDAELMTRLSDKELNDLMVPWHLTEEGAQAGSGLTSLLGAATKERKEREDLEVAIKKKLKTDEDINSISLKDLHQWQVKSRVKRELRQNVGEIRGGEFFEKSKTTNSTHFTLERTRSVPADMGSSASRIESARFGGKNSGSSLQGSSEIRKMARIAKFIRSIPSNPDTPDSPKEDLSSESAEVGSTSNQENDFLPSAIPPRETRKPVKDVKSATPITEKVHSNDKKAGATNYESRGISGDGEITKKDAISITKQLYEEVVKQDHENEVLEKFKVGTPATDRWFGKNNYEVVQTSSQDNNCLIFSLMQHATGRYGEDDNKLANEIRRELGLELGKMLKFTPGIGIKDQENRLVYSLVNAVAQKTKNTTFTPESVVIVTPTTEPGGGDGAPFGDGDDIGKRKIIVYGRNGSRHFEAVKEAG